jgi:hypothetical protein
MSDLTPIRVTVCVPSMSLRRQLRVSPSTTISDLKHCLPSPEFELIFGGSMLAERMSLSFYSVSDGDCILAICKDVNCLDRWTHATEDREAFANRMRTMLDPRLSPELARLRDLRVTRLSARPGMLSAMAALHNSIGKRPDTKPVPTVVEESGSIQPNCEPLPVCWASNPSTLAFRC